MHPSSQPLQIIVPPHKADLNSTSVNSRIQAVCSQAARIHRINNPSPIAEVEMTRYAWIPANLTAEQIRHYFNALPKDKVPIIGSAGEDYRAKQLNRQLPPQDDQERCCKKLKEDEIREFNFFSEQRKSSYRGLAEVKSVHFDKKENLCSECRDSFVHCEMWVVAGKAETGTRWHPACFVCSVCRELLVDLVYFYQDGKLFCGRHHAEVLKRRCSACDEIIFSDECTEAEGRFWHMNHFCCYECDQVLGGDRYIMREGRAFCIKCFEDLYPDYCDTCGVKIGVDEGQFTHEGHRWHVSDLCFRCDNCKTSLLGKPFVSRRGSVFCTGTCSQIQGSAANNLDSKHFSPHYEAGPLPVSHNIRHSLNLENLSVNESRSEVSRQLPERKIGHLIEANALCPDKNNLFEKKEHFTHRANGHFLSKIACEESATIFNQSQKQISVPVKNSSTSVKKDTVSPASTVSSKTTQQNHQHGQNTYKSTDSSGYSSSTVDYLEQSQIVKDYVNLRIISPSYQDAPVGHLRSTENCELDLRICEDCSEVAASEFSFYTGTTAQNLFAAKNYQEKVLQRTKNKTEKNIAIKRSNSTSSSLPVSDLIPAPHSCYPNTGLTRPFKCQLKPDLPDPWLHRSQVQSEVSSPEKVFPKSITAKPTIQRCKSERIFSHSRSKSSPNNNYSPFEETNQRSPISSEKKKESIHLSKSNTDRKELKSILKKTKSSKTSGKPNSRERIKSHACAILPDPKNNFIDKGPRVNFERNHRLYSSSKFPDKSHNNNFIHSPSLRSEFASSIHHPIKVNRSQSEINLGHVRQQVVLLPFSRHQKQRSKSFGRNKRCSKKLKRTRSSDFLLKQPTRGLNSRRNHHFFDDEVNDGWCSTCTSSSDDSDFERWDMLRPSSSSAQSKPRRGSAPAQSVPATNRRPSQPIFTTEVSTEPYSLTTPRDDFVLSNRRKSRESRDKKQCAIQ